MSWYRAGTVSLTNGSGTVTGSGTAFIANAQIGEGFIAPDGRVYEIVGITSDTSLSIIPFYLGSTASGQGYAIAPLRGRIAQLLSETSSLLNSFATVRDGIGAGLMADGTVSAPGLRFTADQDTGVARLGENSVSLVAGGVEALRATNTSVFIGGPGLGSNTGALELGTLRNASGAFLIDISTQAGVDFNTRIIRGSGANGDLEFINTGTGAFAFTQTGNASFSWTSNGVFRLGLASIALFPGQDNALSLGLSSNRYSVVFAATGTINTSDEREKVWLGEPDAAACRAAARIINELGFFQWADGTRIHFGAKAQAVIRVMMDEGLEDEQDIDLPANVFVPESERPSFRHAFLCFDTWQADEHHGAGNRFGLRVDQLALFLIAALAKRTSDQAAQLTSIEARLAALEAA